MKRILIVANLYPSVDDPSFGTFVKEFVDKLGGYLPNYVIEKSVIQGRASSNIKKIQKYVIFYITTFVKLLFNRYDLVYVHYISHSVPPVVLASKFKKLPLAFNVHGDDLLVKNKRGVFFLRLAIPLLNRAKMIVVPSAYFKEVLINRIPNVSIDNIVISPSGGIDKAFFIRNFYPSSCDKELKLGYVSRIDEGKGWDVYLKLVKLLIDNGCQVKATIIGLGAQVEAMEKMISDLELQDIVTYLGAKKHDELPLYYKEFDIFVFPTLLPESLGLVGIEAMAASTPVVGSNIGGLKTFIKDKVNGYLFEPGNEYDLFKSVCAFLNLNMSERCKMRENAYITSLDYEAIVVANKLFNFMCNVYNL